jgi:hypothetical protein
LITINSPVIIEPEGGLITINSPVIIEPEGECEVFHIFHRFHNISGETGFSVENLLLLRFITKQQIRRITLINNNR